MRFGLHLGIKKAGNDETRKPDKKLEGIQVKSQHSAYYP